MPSLTPAFDLVKRYRGDCYDGDINYGAYGCASPWYVYGRWVLLGVIIVGAFLLFCLFSYITARRRRRLGRQPFLGTGWAAGAAPPYPGPQNYYNNTGYNYGQQAPPGGWQQPPPQYGVATADGTHYGKSNPGGVELQSPSQSYQPNNTSSTTNYEPQRGGDEVYSPPTGPPPAKDGVIR